LLFIFYFRLRIEERSTGIAQAPLAQGMMLYNHNIYYITLLVMYYT
jgi:hypothetical protein